eukprot:CAMPEP_0172873596 /NCGR_PEP_ID=MMETSP1075-20121228/95748_1 /TAXON_ID=2916 /ORGANISM="Ceratium fusus, Strain PA161109" /LENGTH=74 /DNA_ID=CAMNT_0013724199 /DNA_START=9 /DNA_END=230 /DNA_ORIENTATION=+
MTVGLGVCCVEQYRQRDMTEKASKAYKFQRAEVVHPLSTSCPCVGPRGGSNMLGSEYEDALNDLQARGAEFKVD